MSYSTIFIYWFVSQPTQPRSQQGVAYKVPLQACGAVEAELSAQDGAGAWLKKPNKEESALRWAAARVGALKRAEVSRPASAQGPEDCHQEVFESRKECYLVHERQNGIDWVERGWD